MITCARREFSARYLVESFEPLEKTAEVIAGEQSCGTFVSLPGETADLKERARARVVRIDPLEDVDEPSLPTLSRAARECRVHTIAAWSR